MDVDQGGSFHIINATQRGLGNRLKRNQTLQGNLINPLQRGNNNVLELNLGSARPVQWLISQEGNGFIKIDIPDYQRFSDPDLRRLEIRQENGGVPIIIRPGRSLNLPLPDRIKGTSN
jgi:hypothetical protein